MCTTVTNICTDQEIEECVEVCNMVWKGIFYASKKMLKARKEAFPQCGLVVGKVDGKVEGYLSMQLVQSLSSPNFTWEQATDSGKMKLSHNPDGDWVFGVGLAVSLKGTESGVTQRLIDFGWDYIVKNNKKGAIFFTRVPGLYKVLDEYSPEEYVLARKKGRPLDPELRMWEKYGFKVVNPPIIIKNYVEKGGDPKSCGISVLIKRENI